MDSRVFQAVNNDDAEGGHDIGGNDRTVPFGKLERAMEIPAIWYLNG